MWTHGPARSLLAFDSYHGHEPGFPDVDGKRRESDQGRSLGQGLHDDGELDVGTLPVSQQDRATDGSAQGAKTS